MKILIVAAYNTNKFSPFVLEQAEALRKECNCEIDFFGIQGKGIKGYLSNLGKLNKKIREFQPDLIHAHYGLSGLLANLQRKVPVVTTYHGSDIHKGGFILVLSKLAMYLSKYNIFVSQKILYLSKYKNSNKIVISCGLDLDKIYSIERIKARENLGLDLEKKYVLFSGSFSNTIKNVLLAKESIALLNGVELLELKGYTREEVNLLMNACDAQLTTSFRESGPLVVKEAMACGTPVVSVDVGDVKEVFGRTEGCYIARYCPKDISEKLLKAFSFRGKTSGRERIEFLQLDNKIVVNKIMDVYNSVLKDNFI